MLRHLFNLLTLLSLLLCVVVVVHWVANEFSPSTTIDDAYFFVEIPYFIPLLVFVSAPCVWVILWIQRRRARRGFAALPARRGVE